MIHIKQLAQNIRRNSISLTYNAKASHIGSALSIADLIAVLYGNILKYDIKNPNFVDRDRFILSKGHACVAVYAALYEVGIISKDLLHSFGLNNSVLMNHISHKVPGVEFSSGSLGHGLSFGVGKALFAQRCNKDWKVYVIVSDGELNEGSNWEAIMFAAHHKLDNLIIIVDYNKLQSLGSIEDTLILEPLTKKFESFGLAVSEINGHDITEIINTFNTVPFIKKKPSVIIANTIKGKGISFMENKVKWHYRTVDKFELKICLDELDRNDHA